MDVLLIAGLWLGAPVWDNVAARLRAHGHRAVPVALPGQGDGNTSATLADQVAAVLAAVDAAARRPMGHSAACSLAWLAAGARPATISKVVLIGGFPSPDGQPYVSGFPSRMTRRPSRAGASSGGRTPPIWTTRPSRPSRRLRSRCRKGARAAWSGWPASAAMTSRWW